MGRQDEGLVGKLLLTEDQSQNKASFVITGYNHAVLVLINCIKDIIQQVGKT